MQWAPEAGSLEIYEATDGRRWADVSVPGRPIPSAH